MKGDVEYAAELSDDDAIKELSKLKGVGRWTEVAGVSETA